MLLLISRLYVTSMKYHFRFWENYENISVSFESWFIIHTCQLSIEHQGHGRHWDWCSMYILSSSLQMTHQDRDFQLPARGFSERLAHCPRWHISKWLETDLTPNANALSIIQHSLRISHSDGNNNTSDHFARCFTSLPSDPLNNFLNNLVQ